MSTTGIVIARRSCGLTGTLPAFQKQCRRHLRAPQPAVPVRIEAKKGMQELMTLLQPESTTRKRAPLRQGKVSPRLTVPSRIPRPPYVDKGEVPWDDDYQIHKAEGLKQMRAACKLAAEVLQYAGTLVKPGVTTDEIDKAVHKMIVDNNAYPSPLTYGNFPKSVCTSVNECICHGIPDSRELQDGDIINIDVTVYLNGYHGDTSSMFFAGEVGAEARQLCETTKLALYSAIKICGPGVPVREIGNVIHAIADKHRLGCVRDFVGHGVGRVFHSAPVVMHCRNSSRDVMLPGMTFTIEPMFVLGRTRSKMWPDNWTVVTADGSLAAQYEHTLYISNSGAEVLTVAAQSS